jgi:DNA repair protein RadC
VIGDDPREHFVALYLDTRNRPIAVHRVHIGTANGAPAHPRDILGPALQLAATAVVVAHNHPSGDPTPSPEDRAVSLRLAEAGRLLGVPLLDHVVVTHDAYRSALHEGA